MAQYLDKTGLGTYHKIVKGMVDNLDLEITNVKNSQITDIGVTNQELTATEDSQLLKIMEFAEADYDLSSSKVLTNKHAINADSVGSTTADVGSAAIPVYMAKGVPTAVTSIDATIISGTVATAAALSTNAGSGTQPIYFSNGKPTASTSNVGGAGEAVYLKNGVVTSAGKFAPLDTNSKIPTSYLPSYVSDVFEYDNKAAFPATGEANKIYVAKDTNLTYRWSGSAYVEISPSIALGTTSETAFAGDKGAEVASAVTLLLTDVKNLLTSKQAAGNYVKYTNNSVNVAGNTKTLSKTSPEALFFPNGIVMGGTAAAAGLVTRGITGVTTPSATGACDKEGLYINFDGGSDNTYTHNVILGAGSGGSAITTSTAKSTTPHTSMGTTYGAIRGDQMVNYVTDKISNKQDKLTFDTAPKANSNNPVTSGGINTALASKADLENGKVKASQLPDVSNIIETTYNALKILRDNSELVPGRQYRITDYQCTTTQTDTSSAGHQFDIIVTADSKNVLNEEARAIQHEGDTYFANSNLKAWKLWYSLDNDTSRFEWADSTNGKGVVYRMIDEWLNDCPYDFKNILFDIPEKEYYNYYGSESKDGGFVWKRIRNNDGENQTISSTDISTAPTAANLYAKVTVATRPAYTNVYTFNADLGQNVDSSVDSNLKNGFLTQLNKIIFNSNMDTSNLKYALPFNVFCVYPSTDSSLPDQILTIGNTIDALSTYNVFKHGSIKNTIGYSSNNNYFAGYSYYNLIGQKCDYNTFGDDCNYNTFGYDCYSNTFGNSCYSNTFGNSCESNTFGDDCYFNTFGNYCFSNTFGDSCGHNTFGNYCFSNTFGDGCYSNIFGNNCFSNTFGDSCESNTFKYNCYSNTFGNNCYSNTFGNNCYSNTFGDGCDYNTFGSSDANNTTNGYFNYNKFEANVQNVNLINPTSNSVYYYHIKSGVTGDFTCESDLNYETIIAKNSKGQIVEYCEADLIEVPITGITISGPDTISANGTYTYTVTTTPTYPTDTIESTVWSTPSGYTDTITMDSSTGKLTVKGRANSDPTIQTVVNVEVTTANGQTFTSTKNINIKIK